MKQIPANEYGKGEDPLRPIDELLEKPLDSVAYPNLIEDYHKLADKDIHLAELYRLAATSQDDRLIPNPIQAVRVDGELWVDVLAEIEPKTSREILAKIMEVHTKTRHFVSGRILVERLPELNRYVKRVQTARPIRPALDTSVKAIHADSEILAPRFSELGNFPPPTGKNVLIGIVDVDCDFLHPNFLDDNGKTRIRYLWDQNGTHPTDEDSHLKYGREYDDDFINQAIQDDLSYENLDYKPGHKNVSEGEEDTDEGHGTHVMDIAAGNSSKYPGVAPDADLIFVHLGVPNPDEIEEEYLGSSKNLCDAVNYIFDKAKDLEELENREISVVVNLSLATNGGPHDGTSSLERLFDELLENQDGRAIVVAAGNSFDKGIHAMDTVTPDTPSEIKWVIKNSDNTWQRLEMEIWYEGQTPLILDAFNSNEMPIGSCELGKTYAKTADGFSEPYILIHHSFDTEANENHINIFIDHRYLDIDSEQEDVEYLFRLRLSSEITSNAVEYHAWIERNDSYPSKFRIAEPRYTINSIANGKFPITVGAFSNFPGFEEKSIWFASSSGPSRNPEAVNQPIISAPGDAIFAAWLNHYKIDDGDEMSGTSQAAPHVSGVIALMFQVARDHCEPPTLNISKIHDILIETADRDHLQDNNGLHDLRYGYGRINCLQALKQVLAQGGHDDD